MGPSTQSRVSSRLRRPGCNAGAICRTYMSDKSRAMRAGRRSRPLADSRARDRSGDHQSLNLRRPLEDRVDLRVAVHPLDGVFARVPVAAEDLDRALGRPDCDLARLELRHRALGVVEVLASATHPGGAPDEEAGGVDLHLHVGEGERDRLVLDDRAAELLALLGVVQRVLVRGARDADGLRADRRARNLERLHGRLTARARALAGACDPLIELLLAAKQTRAGNSAVVEVHVGGVRRPQAVLLYLRALLEPLGPWRHHECCVSSGPELAVDARDDDMNAGDPSVRRPGLLSVQDPLVLGLVVTGGRADRRD